MRWLVHGNVTAAAAEALRRHGHSTATAAEAGIDVADHGEMLVAAHEQRLDVLTADQAIAAAPFEQGLAFGRSIVFLQLEGGDVEQDDAIDRLFQRYKRLAPGRLYTVTGTRVKIRQLPGRKG